MKKNTRKGFTITELVIVIAVIAILAAVLIPTFSGIIEKANKSAALQAARSVYTEVYADDIQDGVIDGTTNGTAAITKPAEVTAYEFSAGAVTNFVYEDDNGYTATFNGSTWTVAES